MILLKSLAVLGIALASISASAQTQPTRYLATSQGVWTFDPSLGKASFCSAFYDAKTGAPVGKCAEIGVVGSSPAGFALDVAGNALLAFSKTTNVMNVCGVVFSTQFVPTGRCEPIGQIN